MWESEAMASNKQEDQQQKNFTTKLQTKREVLSPSLSSLHCMNKELPI
jgi:hypothetical protein